MKEAAYITPDDTRVTFEYGETAAVAFGRAVRISGVTHRVRHWEAIGCMPVSIKDIELGLLDSRPLQNISACIARLEQKDHANQGKFNALPEKSTFTPVRHNKSKRW